MENAKWRESKAMGNIIESVAEYLINSTTSWKCIKYGMENHIEELRNTLRDNKNDTSRRIKTMPDYFVINKNTNEVMLLDVKFRNFIERGEHKFIVGFGYGQIKDYLEFWKDVKLLIVTTYEPYFLIVNVNEIEWFKHFYDRKTINERMMERWNFAGIVKNIKEVFTELKDEILNKAVQMIPSKNER